MQCRFFKNNQCTLALKLTYDFLIDFICYLRDNKSLNELLGKEYIIDEKCTCKLELYVLKYSILVFRCRDDNQEFTLITKLADFKEYYKIEKKKSILEYLVDLYYLYGCSLMKERKCFEKESTLHM